MLSEIIFAFTISLMGSFIAAITRGTKDNILIKTIYGTLIGTIIMSIVGICF